MKYLFNIFTLISFLLAQNELKEFTISDITNSDKFTAPSISSIKWSKDEQVLYYRDDLNDIYYKYNYIYSSGR